MFVHDYRSAVVLFTGFYCDRFAITRNSRMALQRLCHCNFEVTMGIPQIFDVYVQRRQFILESIGRRRLVSLLLQ